MNIEEIIDYHNESLDKQVEENHFLSQRLKAHLNTTVPRRMSVFSSLRKQAFLYAALFLILTMVNIMVIGLIKKDPPQPHPITAVMETFQPDFPGSLSHAYSEVLP